MRFLQITTAGAPRSGPPDPEHMARVRKSIGEAIASGSLVATGPIGKRATSAARLIRKDGKVTVEDPPQDSAGGGGWMAGGGFALTEYASKEDAIADCARKLEIMGDGVMEVIQVGEMHPPPKDRSPRQRRRSLSQFRRRRGGDRLLQEGVRREGDHAHACRGWQAHHALPARNQWRRVYAGRQFPRIRHGRGPAHGQLRDAACHRRWRRLWWDRAIKAGCTERMPFAVAPWGDTYGQMVDPFGVTWAFNTPAKK